MTGNDNSSILRSRTPFSEFKTNLDKKMSKEHDLLHLQLLAQSRVVDVLQQFQRPGDLNEQLPMES